MEDCTNAATVLPVYELAHLELAWGALYSTAPCKVDTSKETIYSGQKISRGNHVKISESKHVPRSKFDLGGSTTLHFPDVNSNFHGKYENLVFGA